MFHQSEPPEWYLGPPETQLPRPHFDRISPLQGVSKEHLNYLTLSVDRDLKFPMRSPHCLLETVISEYCKGFLGTLRKGTAETAESFQCREEKVSTRAHPQILNLVNSARDYLRSIHASAHSALLQEGVGSFGIGAIIPFQSKLYLLAKDYEVMRVVVAFECKNDSGRYITFGVDGVSLPSNNLTLTLGIFDIRAEEQCEWNRAPSQLIALYSEAAAKEALEQTYKAVGGHLGLRQKFFRPSFLPEVENYFDQVPDNGESELTSIWKLSSDALRLSCHTEGFDKKLSINFNPETATLDTAVVRWHPRSLY